MYAKFKWDFLNGKSKSHIDLTVGFNCIVCHIFKLFTNQHFNYSLHWQTLGQIKSSIWKSCRKVCYPENHKTVIGKKGGMRNQEANFRQRWGDLPQTVLRCEAARILPGAPTPTSPLCWSEVAASPRICNWVSFEVDSCLIRQILPFECLSPSCQALFTWTPCSPRVPVHVPFMVWRKDPSWHLIGPRPESAASLPPLLPAPHPCPTSPVPAGLGNLSPLKKVAVGCIRAWKGFLYFTDILCCYQR